MVKLNLNTRNVIIGLSLLLYSVALLNPMYYVTSEISNTESSCCSVSCLHTFLTGILATPFDLLFLCNGNIEFSLIWIFNIVYIYNIYEGKKVLNNKIIKSINIFSIIMIICFYSCHSNISDRDGDIVYYVGEKGVGYFLWSSSLIIVFLLNIFSPDFFKSKRNKPTKDYFRKCQN